MVYGLDAMMELVLWRSDTESNITLLSCACPEVNETLRNSDRTVVWPFYHRKHYVLVVMKPGKDFLRVYDSILNYYSSDRDSDLLKRTGRKHACWVYRKCRPQTLMTAHSTPRTTLLGKSSELTAAHPSCALQSHGS